MTRLRSVGEFIDFRHSVVNQRRDGGGRPTLVVCAGTGGQASGSNDVIRVIKRYILDRGLQDRIGLRVTGCQGFCEMDPFIVVEPGRHLYPKLKMEDVPRVIESALSGRPDEGLLYREPYREERYRSRDDIPFFKHQTRTLLGTNAEIDPIRIINYIEHGGYEAFEKCLLRRDPIWIIEEVKKSGLRGRGGAGFLTGRKWELARAAGKPGEQKYIVCNADEGDPGAYMDRSLLEGNPHAIIEGLMIAGMAIGATQGFIYVRTEYPLAIKHSLIALRQAGELGLLGKNILGSGIDFTIEIVRGAGAFVCGEETALIKSVEGYMGEPRQRPPYPIQTGIGGHPTCINNVETLANVPVIVGLGAEEYAKVGVKGSTGTKIFSLVGKIRNTGLVEVPLGMKISTLVYDIGGGPVGDAGIKAVQTGGPSGGCIPASMFDLAIDYESLTRVGSIMGSGGMIVMDENTCMVDVAKYFMKFLKEESCGKCFSCRKGTQRMWELLDDITRGKGTDEHLEVLEELALVVKDTTMCGLGQTASNPVLSTLKYFRHEYLDHIHNKRCAAFVCKDLVGAPCGTACPIGTEAWRYVAYIGRGEYDEAYSVIREANPFPSVCARVCSHPCESRCRSGQVGNQPIAIRNLKRFITDRIDPASYRPKRRKPYKKEMPRVAVVGSGPAGLTAAHYLSLAGYKITVFEADAEPGGMLIAGIPSYRLPKDILRKEIASVLDQNVTVECNTALGRDVTINMLLKNHQAVFLAMGAHKSRRLGVEGEELLGVYPANQFLKAFNFRGEKLASGRVGVIGGGNSAVDSARMALRCPGVTDVTLLYRRSRREMPALDEEIEAAVTEGVKLETLVSPSKILSREGKVTGVECLRNVLGDIDSSGRRKPEPVPGSEFTVPVDTLIITIGDVPDIDYISYMGVETTKWGTVKADMETLSTNLPGVFAGGDVVTGPDTVVWAIAHGKKAAVMIDRYLKGEPLKQPAEPRLPKAYVEPQMLTEDEMEKAKRVEPPTIAMEARTKTFDEVERTMSVEEAGLEARRCLRCDLEFTQPKEEKAECLEAGGKKA